MTKQDELGSPPQVRGKLLKRLFPLHNTRITPAGAGKTFCLLFLSIADRDHPRRCGENNIIFGVFCPFTGSPPQVRGKLF